MLKFSEDYIIRYFENECSEEEELILLEWLKKSEENAVSFLTIKKLYYLKKIKLFSDQQYLNNAFSKFYQNKEAILKKRKQLFLQRFSKYAAVFLITIMVLISFWIYFKERPAKLITVTSNTTNPVKTAILPDGTKVWINSKSTFSYPVAFSKKERKVILEGEAYFEVRKDSLHPFIVQTHDVYVKVLGTSFNVNTQNNDSITETTLVNGKVVLQNRFGKDIISLLPGQLAQYNSKTRTSVLSNVNTDVYTGWRLGLMIFDNSSLTEITKAIEKFYQVRITINSKTTSQNKYNFVFRETQTLETVLEMLQFVAPITYKRYDEQIFINLK